MFKLTIIFSRLSAGQVFNQTPRNLTLLIFISYFFSKIEMFNLIIQRRCLLCYSWCHHCHLILVIVLGFEIQRGKHYLRFKLSSWNNSLSLKKVQIIFCLCFGCSYKKKFCNYNIIKIKPWVSFDAQNMIHGKIRSKESQKVL